MENGREVTKRWELYKESQYKSARKYTSKFSAVRLLLDPDVKEEMAIYCKDRGVSVSEFIRTAIKEKMDRDG